MVETRKGLDASYARQLVERSFARSVVLPLQVWKFHGAPVLRLALTGGELVSGYAVYFRDLYGGSNNVVIGGYANEVPCYIPSNELLPWPGIELMWWLNGSYGGGWDMDFPGIAGGSMMCYGYLGHFLKGEGGVEDLMISMLNSLIA